MCRPNSAAISYIAKELAPIWLMGLRPCGLGPRENPGLRTLPAQQKKRTYNDGAYRSQKKKMHQTDGHCVAPAVQCR